MAVLSAATHLVPSEHSLKLRAATQDAARSWPYPARHLRRPSASSDCSTAPTTMVVPLTTDRTAGAQPATPSGLASASSSRRTGPRSSDASAHGSQLDEALEHRQHATASLPAPVSSQ